MHRKTLALESLFNKIAGLRPVTLLKKRCFPVNSAKCLGAPFIHNTSEWLLLQLFHSQSDIWTFMHLPMHLFTTTGFHLWSWVKNKEHFHYVKSVQIWRFFWSIFFLYSVQIKENTDQKKLGIWTLLTQCLISTDEVAESVEI